MKFMRRSTFALLAAGMLVVGGTSDLRAQDADAEATPAEDATSDVQIVEAMIFNPGAATPTILNVEFGGSGDELTAALTVPDVEGFRMEMTDLKLSDGAFTYSFLEPGGTTIDCDLMRLDDNSFRGECDAGGVPIEMTIEAFEE
jgi:hypothetical protein